MTYHTEAAPDPADADGQGFSAHRPWWETRAFVAAMILMAAVPLLLPPIPPLVDLLGHMGRYRVELDLAHSPELQRYYGFQWAMMGNLGVDLLIWPLGKLLGLEAATKLIVIAIPMLTVAGMLWVAREVHGRLPPTVAFALPFAYGHHFLFGFVNYALSVAMALLAFGLWLRLGRLGKIRQRAMLFVPISAVIWVAHAFGWGLLGLLAFSAEAVRQHDRGRGWIRSGPHAAYHCLALALPMFMMIAWREHAGGLSAGWLEWSNKWLWLKSALRDRWFGWDMFSVTIVAMVLVLAIVHPRLTLSRMLGFTTFVLTLAFVCLPRVIFGSAYGDMRIVPFLLAMAVLAIRFKDRTDMGFARPLAILAMLFVVARTVSVGVSLDIASREQRALLTALDHVPRGAAVLTLVKARCHSNSWALGRTDHIGGMVVERRLGFANNQWLLPGAPLLKVHYAQAGEFSNDPSQLVVADKCPPPRRPIDTALSTFPRDAFQYVWMIDPPPYDRSLVAGWTAVWEGPNRSMLYRLPAAPDGVRP